MGGRLGAAASWGGRSPGEHWPALQCSTLRVDGRSRSCQVRPGTVWVHKMCHAASACGPAKSDWSCGEGEGGSKIVLPQEACQHWPARTVLLLQPDARCCRAARQWPAPRSRSARSRSAQGGRFCDVSVPSASPTAQKAISQLSRMRTRLFADAAEGLKVTAAHWKGGSFGTGDVERKISRAERSADSDVISLYQRPESRR